MSPPAFFPFLRSLALWQNPAELEYLGAATHGVDTTRSPRVDPEFLPTPPAALAASSVLPDTPPFAQRNSVTFFPHNTISQLVELGADRTETLPLQIPLPQATPSDVITRATQKEKHEISVSRLFLCPQRPRQQHKTNLLDSSKRGSTRKTSSPLLHLMTSNLACWIRNSFLEFLQMRFPISSTTEPSNIDHNISSNRRPRSCTAKQNNGAPETLKPEPRRQRDGHGNGYVPGFEYRVYTNIGPE